MFKPSKEGKEPRGQLNVDVGKSRRGKLKAYCKSQGITISSCIKQMIDYCMKHGKGAK